MNPSKVFVVLALVALPAGCGKNKHTHGAATPTSTVVVGTDLAGEASGGPEVPLPARPEVPAEADDDSSGDGDEDPEEEIELQEDEHSDSEWPEDASDPADDEYGDE